MAQQRPMALLDKSAPEAARLLALGYLADAEAAGDRLVAGGDAEALHDLRVGLRRLRSCLAAYREVLASSVGKKWRRRLRVLAQATNAGRDAEVQLAWVTPHRAKALPRHRGGVAWLAERLGRDVELARDQAAHDVVPELAQVARELRGRLATYEVTCVIGEVTAPVLLGAVAAGLVRQQTAELVELLEQSRQGSAAERLHATRIAAKRLRYLLEPLKSELAAAAAVVKDLRALQEVLGEWNDRQVLGATLAGAVEQASAERARELHARMISSQVPAKARRVSHRKVALVKPSLDARPGLLHLAKVASDERTALVSQLGRKFGASWSKRLGAATEAVAVELEGYGAPATEIERKYLLSALPREAKRAPCIEIEQGWIPGKELHERLRRTAGADGEHFYRTVKLGKGVKRIEVEDECSREVFLTLWSLTKGKRIHKRRYQVAQGDFVWEIDEFLGRDLVLAEIELPSEETTVDPPGWLAKVMVRDVTNESTYVNINLAS